jgi:hypothetical protein
MKHVVSISLGSSSQDFDFVTEFLGEKLHVRRVGTNGSTPAAVKLIKQWDKKAAAIGLGVLKDSYKVGSRRFIEKDSARLKAIFFRSGRCAMRKRTWAVFSTMRGCCFSRE